MYIFFLLSLRIRRFGKIVLKSIIAPLAKFERFSKLQGIGKGTAFFIAVWRAFCS